MAAHRRGRIGWIEEEGGLLATSIAAALVGVEAHLIRVEADTAPGFPGFTMVGLPDSAVRESEARIRAALRNCGFSFKWDRRITVNLAPASLRKCGSAFDLATALGLLAADGALPQPRLREALLVGELALDGSVRPVSGVLPMLLLARRQGLAVALVPRASLTEAALVPGLAVHPVASLVEAATLLTAEELPPAPAPPSPAGACTTSPPDLADVRGQLLARRALEIAAAGGHNLLLIGPPGSGKTMLASRLPGLLPPLSADEATEVAAIHSAAGLGWPAPFGRRPFRAPHHSASQVALVGGGPVPRPGEVSLAHHGVLFLDELPEFHRAALEALRQPIEEGHVTVVRARASATLPARFQLVAAMNPCPCGGVGGACRCTPTQARAYGGRVSGPFLDRIDLFVPLTGVSFGELLGPPGEPTLAVRDRIAAARARQTARAARVGAPTNAQLPAGSAREIAMPGSGGVRLLEQASRRLALTGRGLDRLLRVARTIADLSGREGVAASDVAEAVQFRDGLTARCEPC
jgi:magnesium chelatase family protein